MSILFVGWLIGVPVGSLSSQSDHNPLPPATHSGVGDLPIAEMANARALFQFGRTEDAIVAFDAMLARQPDWVPALVERGNLFKMLGRQTEARRDLERALRLNPVAARFYSARSNYALLQFIALYPDDWFYDHYQDTGFVAGLSGNLTLAMHRDRQSSQLETVANRDETIEFLRLKLRGEDRLLRGTDLAEADHSRQWKDLMLGNLALLRQDLTTALRYYNDAVLSGAYWPELYYNRGLTSILLNNYANGCADLRQSYNLGFTPGESMLRSLCTF